MTDIKPSSHGIVVDHKGSGIRYAVSDKNYNSKVHRKVRDLNPGETVRGFQPLSRESLSETVAALGTPTPTGDAAGDATETQALKAADTQTEGSAPAGTKGNK